MYARAGITTAYLQAPICFTSLRPAQWFCQPWESGVPSRPGPGAVDADSARPACGPQARLTSPPENGPRPPECVLSSEIKTHPCTETNLPSFPQVADESLFLRLCGFNRRCPCQNQNCRTSSSQKGPRWRQSTCLNRFQPDRGGSACADKTQRICPFHLPPSQAEIPAQTGTCRWLGTIRTC